MQIQITIVDMKLRRTIYKGTDCHLFMLKVKYSQTKTKMEEKKKQQKQNDFGGPNGHLGV